MRRNPWSRQATLLYIITILGAVSGLWAGVPRAPAAGATPPPPALTPFLPAQVDELSQVEAAPGLWAAAYSYRDPGSVPHSAILVVESPGPDGRPRLLWKSREAELYNPAVTLQPRLTYQGRPIVLISRQLGAAWAQVDVLGFRDRQPLHLDTRNADFFETVNLSPGAGPQLLAYRRPYVSPLPEVLSWDGKKFIPASHQYPQYYEALIKQGGELQETDFKPLEMALLTALAGRREEARRQLEQLLRAQKRLGARANRQLQKAVELELRKLEAGP